MEKKKRDFLEEIKSIKSRSEFNSRFDYSSRLDAIENALDEFLHYNGTYSNEILKYIPISTIACFEAFFRSTVKEIIDFGKPYSDNVAIFNNAKNIRLDFETVAAIQSKSLTIGELVAHTLPYNNYEDISFNLKTLLGKDFTSELKLYKSKSIFTLQDDLTIDFKKKSAEIFKSVKRTYELRHIFCHEFATNLVIDKDEILINFQNCKIFLEHVNNFIWHELYPNAPETQFEMTAQVQSDLELKENKLSQLIKLIKASVKNDDFYMHQFNEKLFDKCIKSWEVYKKLHAEYSADYVKGGSMYQHLYASDMINITEEKIQSLENEFEYLLRKIK